MNNEIERKISTLRSSTTNVSINEAYKSFPEYNISKEDHKKAIKLLDELIFHIETDFARNQFLEDLTIKMLEAAIKISKNNFNDVSEEEHKALKRAIVSFEGFHNKYNSPYAAIIREAVRCFFNKLNPVYLNGCYIATCVYGSYDCPQVWTLRRYRDNILSKTWYGKAFIHTYYAISPTLVKWFGHTNWFKKLWVGTLNKMVENLQSNGVESTPYEDKRW